MLNGPQGALRAQVRRGPYRLTHPTQYLKLLGLPESIENSRSAWSEMER